MEKKRNIVLFGDTNVGKTAIVKRWLHISYTEAEASPTYCAGFFENDVFVNDKNEKIQVWDTAGEEKYRSMAPIYTRGAIGILLLFDLTRRTTLENIPFWLDAASSAGDIPVVVVGNKADLVAEREVKAQEAIDFLKERNLPFIEASALTGFGVDEAFMEIINKAIEYADPVIQQPSFQPQDQQQYQQQQQQQQQQQARYQNQQRTVHLNQNQGNNQNAQCC